MTDFIINPTSKVTKGAKIWKEIEEELKRRELIEGRDYKVYFTKPDKRADQIARELCRSQETLFFSVLGGDGTLNEVINGLDPGKKAIVNYIPTGSGNDFARSIGLDSDPVKGVDRVIQPGYYRKLDLGIVSYADGTTRRFAVSAGVGYDADVCVTLNQTDIRKKLKKIHLGKLGYLIVGIWKVFCCAPIEGTLFIDDTKKKELHNTRFISAHIQPYEGGGFCFAPSADAADGLLTLCVINHCSKGKFLFVLIASLFKKHMLFPGVSIIPCKKAVVKLSKAHPVHTDGEVRGNECEFEIACQRGALQVITGKKD